MIGSGEHQRLVSPEDSGPGGAIEGSGESPDKPEEGNAGLGLGLMPAPATVFSTAVPLWYIIIKTLGEQLGAWWLDGGCNCFSDTKIPDIYFTPSLLSLTNCLPVH
jgi:hypothetical protein